MKETTIRKARAADAPEITVMIRELGDFHNDRAAIDVEDLIFLCFGPSPWTMLLVAERDGQLLGYAALQRKVQLQFARRLLDVQHLFVKAEARGCGVGRALIEAACDIAKVQRCVGVTLGVTEQNLQAQAFYCANGFAASETSGALKLLRRLDLRAPSAAP